ncbi:hypothetical protein AURDEDRAFT_181627 [Auricularia subglabra TFB-10046 SS5]|nr:hypothetical protein AURDEDRAFT_181627 [Auricularia subglabra TFB-10046 SS5]
MSATAPLSSLAQPSFLETETARMQLVANEAELASLLVQIEVIRSRIAALKQLIAPVRRLPPEILSPIIVRSATAPDAPAQVLRTLCSVCRFWRHTALRTPEAWSKIHVVYDRGPCPPGPRTWLRTLRDMQEWLRNSRSSKKDVRMDLGDDLSAYVELLRPYMGQVRILAIHPAFLGDTINVLLGQALPHLEEFISFGYNPHSTPLIPEWSLAPAVERVLCTDGQLFILPRNQRRQLTRLGIASDDLATILNFCHEGGFPALRVLTIDGGNYISDMPADAALTLPQLEAFHLTFYEPQEITGLFLHLKLPRLVTLSLCSQLLRGDVADEAAASETSAQLATLLRGLIDTSAPPLRRLFLRAFLIRDEDLFNTLTGLPALERLLLTDVPVTPLFTRLLAGRNRHYQATDWVCRQLTHISVSSSRDWTPIQVAYSSQDWTNAAPNPMRVLDMEATVRARAEEVGRNPEAMTKLTHVRVYDTEMRTVDGKVCWFADKSVDSLYHPRIFRDAYVPVDRWWRIDKDTIGTDLLGL